jgi:hypothetical protein
MISKFKALINKVIPKQEEESKVECLIDNEVVPCDTLDQTFYSPEAQGAWYTGVPAPAYLEEDPWFVPPVYSENQITVKEAYEHVVADNQILEESGTSEPSDIHERIYQIATANWNTVDETKESMGGSENFQEGPRSWNSGTGMRQFYG